MKPLLVLLTISLSVHAASLSKQWQVEDEGLMNYFRRETRALSDQCLVDVKSVEGWQQRLPKMREQLADMLGLSPLPDRSDLKAMVTGQFEHDTFTVEKLHFQSQPGLYVTANLYVPKNLTKAAPTILYVCGHGPMVTNSVSYGTKVTYQHHGIWFARNGYVCLIIDTLESGEILGNHHGTHRDGMWWWNARGYTPAGVETWNVMRALDYLSTRPEVDTNRFGITGRSGGGAYSWFVTAMDARIKAAAPVAGITDLENHVVDGAVEGHCDCMFFVNTYRWDYPQLAALAAPRPLLLCNTDSDGIFPLDGVTRTQAKVKRIYELLGAAEKFGLVITPGPHKDTQELQVPVMRWFNRYLKGEESLIENAAVKLFTPQQLKVFDKLPTDAVNTNIHFTFVRPAQPAVPKTKSEWNMERDAWLAALRRECFAAWPTNSLLTRLTPGGSKGGFGLYHVDGSDSDQLTRAQTSLQVFLPQKQSPRKFILNLGDYRDSSSAAAIATLDFREHQGFPAKKQTQIRRRHMLLGETLDSTRVWKIARALQAIHASKQFGKLPVRIEAEGDMAVNALYASLFAPVDELALTNLPKSHMNGPDYLNVLRILDVPQAVAMASERSRVELRGADEADWQYPLQTTRNLGWENKLRIAGERAGR